MHILLIEDDIRIATNIMKMLAIAGFTATIARTAHDALLHAETESYDVIILDWMLPDIEGIAVCRMLREQQNMTPIIMLTAKSQLEDKVEGLLTGADDYLTKPFEMEELLARVKALIRRKSGKTLSPVIRVADLTVNANTHEVTRGGTIISLAPREYSLLEYLLLHIGEAIDRLALLHHVWGENTDPFSNTVDVHVRYLRKKIDDPFSKKLIKTVKGKGYMVCDD